MVPQAGIRMRRFLLLAALALTPGCWAWRLPPEISDGELLALGRRSTGVNLIVHPFERTPWKAEDLVERLRLTELFASVDMYGERPVLHGDLEAWIEETWTPGGGGPAMGLTTISLGLIPSSGSRDYRSRVALRYAGDETEYRFEDRLRTRYRMGWMYLPVTFSPNWDARWFGRVRRHPRAVDLLTKQILESGVLDGPGD